MKASKLNHATGCPLIIKQCFRVRYMKTGRGVAGGFNTLTAGQARDYKTYMKTVEYKCEQYESHCVQLF